jgi:adenosylhomocysteine nucleosidase
MAKPKAKKNYIQADIGIVTALPIELGEFLSRCARVNKYKGDGFVFRGGNYDKIRVATVESGMGYARARRAAISLVKSHSPKWLLSCGFAGALQEGMQIGNIVMVNSIVDQHGQEMSFSLNVASNESEGLYVGRILTADEMVRTVDEKKLLAEKHNAIAVDMETLAVAQVAQEHQLGFMGIRSISDDLSADLPPEVLSVVGDTGAVRVGAALSSFVKRPGSFKDMLGLRDTAQRAANNLAVFLDGVVHQLSGS